MAYKDKVITGDGEHTKEQIVEFKEVDWANDKTRAFIDDTEFDGHYVLWGFEYFPTNYMKCSDLSGNEWRKGGEIRYFRNRKQVYSEFCREPLIAHNIIGARLLELQEFNWDNFKVGTKVWYRELPCIITMLCEEQGCAILEREDGKCFPNAVWYDESSCSMGEGEKTVKIDVLDKNVYWYR